MVVIITNLAEIRAKRREKIDDVNDEVERLSSEKSGQIQIIDSIKIFNIEIITSGEGTEVLSTVQNNTQEVLGDFEVIIKLKDINTIDEAESLKDMMIEMERKDAPSLPEGTYYINDLIGFEVYSYYCINYIILCFRNTRIDYG